MAFAGGFVWRPPPLTRSNTHAAAFDAGVNTFDNAEVYARGRSEELMGQVLKTLAWPRLNYVVSTKSFWERSPDWRAAA